jgi:hypothetical protein
VCLFSHGGKNDGGIRWLMKCVEGWLLIHCVKKRALIAVSWVGRWISEIPPCDLCWVSLEIDIEDVLVILPFEFVYERFQRACVVSLCRSVFSSFVRLRKGEW